MIISGKPETYDGTWRVVNYETETEGRLIPRLEASFADATIPQYYVQQELNLQRLQKQLLAGEISPVGLYMGLTRMTVEDVASRMRLRKSVVEAHMTPEGFGRARVRDLEGYARQFDISVADLFQLLVLEGGVRVADSKNSLGRLLQTMVIAPSRPEDVSAEERKTKAP